MKPMFRLDGKVTVVIGGAGGLGEACAVALANQGANLIIASRGVDKLKGVAEKIKNETGNLPAVMQVDVSSEESVAKLADQVLQQFKTVDVLVNAQGINVKIPATEIDTKRWDELFATNVRGVVMPCRYFGKTMVANKKGKIINLSSVRGIRGVGGGNVLYGATKGAVDMITRMLAVEWAEYNINVNAIGPSVVLTEMMKKIYTPERAQASAQKMLFKRLVVPEDVAAMCVYLASEEANNVTGQIMYVDGGLTAVG